MVWFWFWFWRAAGNGDDARVLLDVHGAVEDSVRVVAVVGVGLELVSSLGMEVVS